MIKYSPTDGVKIKKDSMEEKKEMQIYNHDEIEKLRDALNLNNDELLTNMVMLTLYTGLRRGELFGLQPIDINFKTKEISIIRTRVSVEGIPTVKGTKNHKSRTFLLPDCAIELLTNACKGKKPTDFIFDVHPDTFTKKFKKLQNFQL